MSSQYLLKAADQNLLDTLCKNISKMEIQVSGCVFSSLFLELANSQGDIVSTAHCKVYGKDYFPDNTSFTGRVFVGRS